MISQSIRGVSCSVFWHPFLLLMLLLEKPRFSCTEHLLYSDFFFYCTLTTADIGNFATACFQWDDDEIL